MATKHVAKTGNDANSGNDIFNAKLTINGGAAVVGASDTLEIHAGTYNEALFNLFTSGTFGNPTRIKATAGETVWLTPLSGDRGICYDGIYREYLEFDGINVNGDNITGYPILFNDNNGDTAAHCVIKNAEVKARTGYLGGQIHGIVLGGVGSNTVQNMRIHGGGNTAGCGTNCSGYGVYLASPNNIIELNDIYDTTSACVHIYSGGGNSTDNNIIRWNTFRDISRTEDDRMWAVLISGNNNKVYGNKIYGLNVPLATTNSGVYVYAGSGNKIWSNTMYNNVAHGVYLGPSAATTTIQNNIIYLYTGTSIVNNGSGTTIDHNLIDVNPIFVNGAAGDFRITETSPAFGYGVDIPEITEDAAGNMYGDPPSAGAYEVADAVVPDVWERIAWIEEGGAFDTVTTGSINTTGADLLIVGVARFTGGSTDLIVSDSKSNTWVALTDYINASGIGYRFYYVGNSPTVGSGHTVTVSNATDSIYPSVVFSAFSGSMASPFGAENGMTTVADVSALHTGAVFPTELDTLVVAGLAHDNNSGGAISIDLGYTALVQDYLVGNHEGAGLAYKVLTTPSSQNPTWNTTNTNVAGMSTAIAYFKSQAASAGILMQMMQHAA